MAITVNATNNIGTGVIVPLGEFNSSFIPSGVTIASLDTYAIVGTGNKQSVTIYGNVIGEARGVSLGDDGGGDYGFRVNIGTSGVLLSNTSTALSVQGFNSRIVNSGDILSNAVAINIDSYNTETFTQIRNRGTIESDGTSIRHTGTEHLIVENDGRIVSINKAIDDDVSVIEVTNTGTIVGQANLGGGADFFDTIGGRLKGALNAGSGADLLYGSAYGDNFDGDADNDKIYGYAGNDTLKGGTGNDYIDGGSGNDLIYGGSGKDTLYGGSGADRFIFVTEGDSTVLTSNRDLINKFSHSEGDRIDLSQLDANTDTVADNAFKFIGTSAFSNVEGQLRAVTSGSTTVIYGDTDGDRKADFAITLNQVIKLASSDFIL